MPILLRVGGRKEGLRWWGKAQGLADKMRLAAISWNDCLPVPASYLSELVQVNSRTSSRIRPPLHTLSRSFFLVLGPTLRLMGYAE
jgi:hypothetical protein